MNDKTFTKFRPFLILLLSLAGIELLLWLLNEWIGYFLNALLVLLSFFTLTLSYIFEHLERSKIPYWYFPVIWIIFGVSFTVFMLMSFLNDFQFSW